MPRTHGTARLRRNRGAAVEPAAQAARPEDYPVRQAEVLNRELSWLEFNARVLHEAMDPRTPLLERVRFLGIFTSNLDEFFMKRVGGLKRQLAAGVGSRNPDRMSPAQQLAAIRSTVARLQDLQAECFRQLRGELDCAGVHLIPWDRLTPAQRQEAEAYFRATVFPILTPLAVDPGHPFPFISNLSESLGVVVRQAEGAEDMFARIKVPEVLARWVRLNADAPAGHYCFASLYDLIAHNLDDLFPNMRVVDTMLFRVTRNADIERDEEDADDLLEMIAQEVRERRFAQAVRLEHGPSPSRWILDFLMQELELTEADVYEQTGELDYQDLRPIAELGVPSLRYEPWAGVAPPPLNDADADIFSIIRAGDVLVHHPYETFACSVERFIRAAVADPKVLAIKMTVYRTGDDSPLIRTLIEAAEAGKHVVCLVELKARFDESRNIKLAQELEDAGVHVVYGIVGLKTHTKTALVVRQDPDGIRCYAHIGTGNYHSQTAKLYTDLSLLTCNPQITEDLVELFHYLTGRSQKKDYRKLLVAPVNMRERFLAMIAREIEHQKAGRPSGIIAKMNSLEDAKTCRALYDASQAGVKVDLIVRGFCCLRPGLSGLSENIRVVSIIGRFLEHSRIFHFRNGAADPVDGEFYIGSADWMYRNLMARVEAVVAVEDRRLRTRLWEILQIMFDDHRQAWDMQPDGTYVQRRPRTPEDIGTHQRLMLLARQRAGLAVDDPA